MQPKLIMIDKKVGSMKLRTTLTLLEQKEQISKILKAMSPKLTKQNIVDLVQKLPMLRDNSLLFKKLLTNS